MGGTVPPELIPTATAPQGFEVMPANWSTLKAWLACATQWRVVTAGTAVIWLGLDYPAVDIVLRRRQLDADLADLQVMETAALDVLAEARS